MAKVRPKTPKRTAPVRPLVFMECFGASLLIHQYLPNGTLLMRCPDCNARVYLKPDPTAKDSEVRRMVFTHARDDCPIHRKVEATLAMMAARGAVAGLN